MRGWPTRHSYVTNKFSVGSRVRFAGFTFVAFVAMLIAAGWGLPDTSSSTANPRFAPTIRRVHRRTKQPPPSSIAANAISDPDSDSDASDANCSSAQRYTQRVDTLHLGSTTASSATTGSSTALQRHRLHHRHHVRRASRHHCTRWLRHLGEPRLNRSHRHRHRASPSIRYWRPHPRSSHHGNVYRPRHVCLHISARLPWRPYLAI